MPAIPQHPNQKFVTDALAYLKTCSWFKAVKFYTALAENPATDRWIIAQLARGDRYFLLVYILHRRDLLHPWIFERCREVEAQPDGALDLWFREAGKSSVITFGGSIQEIIKNPEITIGLFSHTKPTARKFLLQIKTELETNATLKELYFDIFYQNPERDSPKWSEEKGIVVKRVGNPKEATVEAHGLVDGQPTGAHFALRIYDDVVTLESVSTPEQVEKTTNAWAMSDNLGAADPITGQSRAWHIGTRFTFADTYQEILDRKILTPRIYPGTENGLPDGKAVFRSQEWLDNKRETLTSAQFAAQILQNPAAGNEALFKKEWLRFIDVRPATLNVYIMVDPASSKKKGSDRTAMPVVGIDAGNNYWLLDGYHHKMGLTERWHNLKTLRKHWLNVPGVQSVKVGYERYGSTSDLEYFEEMMQRDRDAFDIAELAWPRDGPGSKFDRIQRLEPAFRAGRWYFPAEVGQETRAQRQMKAEGQAFRIFVPVKRRDENGNIYTVVGRLLEEYPIYPFSAHDDGLDAIARIFDLEPCPPIIIRQSDTEPEVYSDVC